MKVALTLRNILAQGLWTADMRSDYNQRRHHQGATQCVNFREPDVVSTQRSPRTNTDTFRGNKETFVLTKYKHVTFKISPYT